MDDTVRGQTARAKGGGEARHKKAPVRAIEDYGVIGDLSTVALVSKEASIDFLCFPEFDSPTVFAALLDDERGGAFQIRPCVEGARVRQLYLPETNVLLTRFMAQECLVEITDFMPITDGGPDQRIVRRVAVVRGEAEIELSCAPRFDYGRREHRLEVNDCEALFTPEDGQGPLRLVGERPFEAHGADAVARFHLSAGECADFVLERAGKGTTSSREVENYAHRTLMQTVDFWQKWAARSTYSGRWREIVTRSALVLKLLTSQRYGSIVAAPTFGLPEDPGGVRNWDYRFTWIRDASFTLRALIRLGYTDEANAFMRWIDQRCTEPDFDGRFQVMYGIDGRHDLPETELDHFSGYENSRPVRIGNAAHDQLQLDIYGALLDAVYLSNKYGEPISHDSWMSLTRTLNWLADNWNAPDEGIWEVRGGRRQFLHSRVMCWVAFDRALRLAWRRSLPCPFERWTQERDEIHTDIFNAFWNKERGAFMQYKGGHALDAAALMMPMLKIVSPRDPRWLSTLQAIGEDLAMDSLVRRYRTEDADFDGLPGDEGCFLPCTFWYVECLALAGETAKARLYFEKALGYANHLGLFSEELGLSGEHLGNYPQALTHLSLISAAFALDNALVCDSARSHHAPRSATA